MRLLTVIACLAALVGTAAAAKKKAYEVNDTAKQAYKVKYGKAYKAGIDRIASPANTLTDDYDWFRFKARKSEKLTVAFRNIGNKGVPCFGPVLQALNSDKKLIKFVQPANDSSKRLRFNVVRGRKYFLLVTPHNVQQCDTPERYAFQLLKSK